MTGQRVVSLLPATTEIVHALACGDRLVGRSHECDHPPGVEALPVVSRPRAPLTGGSAAIDRDVRELVRDGLGVYEIDPDVLAALDPDVVLTQSACEVCAVSADVVHGAVTVHLGGEVVVVDLQPVRLADVLDDHRRVAAALGVPERAEAVVAALEARLAVVAEAVDGLPAPVVGVVEWLDPLIAAGSWLPDLVAHAGGRAALGAAGGHAPTIGWGDLAAADPDVLVLAPCGFELDRTLAELPEVAAASGVWGDLRAVVEGRAFVVDGHQLVNRPGPRVVDTVELLAGLFHPGRLPTPAGEGDRWVRVGPDLECSLEV